MEFMFNEYKIVGRLLELMFVGNEYEIRQQFLMEKKDSFFSEYLICAQDIFTWLLRVAKRR